MSDKDFKVKNKLVLNGLTQTGPLVADSNKQVDATPYLTTLQGGTGTTTSPSSGQILYSSSGTTYSPTTLSSLDVKGATYSADAPSSPFVGQVWVESDSSSDSFDPNIIRRKSFTATAGQTVFTTDLEFIQGYEQVFFNGMLLLRNSDYTTASNTNVTLASGAAAGDIVEVVSITNLNSINTATTTTNTFTGNQIIQGNVGINKTNPESFLHIGSSSGNAGGPSLLINGESNTERIHIRSAGNTGPGTSVVSLFGARNTIVSPTATQSGDQLGYYQIGGYDGTSWVRSSWITGTAEQNWTTSARGSNLIFSTTPINSTNIEERMRIHANGLVDMGVLKSTRFDANTTLTDSTLRTYSANTWYNLGTFPITSSETFFCQFVIQMTDVNYHTYIGCFIMPATYWKNSGTLWTQTFVAEQHNGNNATVTVRLNVSSGNRSIDFQTDQNITVTTGGFVKLKMKRMFQHD